MNNTFFIASKLFWILARPESWIVLLLVLSVLAFWRGRRRQGMGMLLSCLAFVVFVGIVPVGEALLRPLETRFPAMPDISDPAGIIVLGGGEDSRGMHATGLPGVNDAAERFLEGMALARMFPETKLLFSGGSGSLSGRGISGADVAARIFEAGGIPAERVLLESASRNTAENAAFARELVEAPRVGPWILVTSAFHMPRAVGSFCAAGWREITPYPVDFRGLGGGLGWDLAGHLQALNVAIKEWIGLVAYRVTVRTEEMLPTGC